MIRIILISLSSLFLLLAGCGKTTPQTPPEAPPASPDADLSLTFGIYTADKPTTTVAEIRPVLSLLEKSLSESLGKTVAIEMQIEKTYEEGIDSIVEGKVDFGKLGPASYVTAKKREPKLRVLAMESSKGAKVFNGIIAVHKESTITDVEQLKGKRFAFGDELSTIGRYLSQLHLLENGVRAEDLKEYKYLGRHDKVGSEVAAGNFDAGALKESTFKKQVTAGLPLKELARFPNVTKPWVGCTTLDDELATALGKALQDIQDEAALDALGKQGFLAGTDEDYQFIRDSMEKNPAFFETAQP